MNQKEMLRPQESTAVERIEQDRGGTGVIGTWWKLDLWSKNYWGLLELRRYLKQWGSGDLSILPTNISLEPPVSPAGKSVQVMQP